MALALDDIIQVSVYWTYGVQTAFNVLHYRVASTAGASLTESAAAEAFRANCQAASIAILSSSAQYYGCGLQRLLPAPPGAIQYSSGAAVAGSVAGDPLPRFSCGVMTKKTALAGARNRGRVYCPFPAESSNDTDGTPTPGYMTNLNALGIKWFSLMTLVVGADGVGLRPQVYSKKFGLTNEIVTFVPRKKWGVMHSRGDYGRPNPPPFP